jgi:hypothetical protein
MQLISVYLYSNKVDAYCNASASWPKERYRQVYNRNLKIYRGVDNKIDFQVKNSDQKALAITGSIVVFSLTNKQSGELILQKDCVVQSSLTGKVFVLLSEFEMRSLEPGNYSYCLHREVRTPISGGADYTISSKSPLYTDSQYSVNATIEIYGDVFGEVQPSFETTAFEERVSFESAAPSKFYSSIIPANPKLTTPQSIHTFQFDLSNYFGQIVIEASQEDSAAPLIWADIDTINCSGENILYKNITGKFNWFRIRHTPSFTNALAKFTIEQTIFLTYNVSMGDTGMGYQVGDVITFNGGVLGGETPTNNLSITITEVDQNYKILNFTHQGVSYNGVRTFVLTDLATGFGTVDKVIYR